MKKTEQAVDKTFEKIAETADKVVSPIVDDVQEAQEVKDAELKLDSVDSATPTEEEKADAEEVLAEEGDKITDPATNIGYTFTGGAWVQDVVPPVAEEVVTPPVVEKEVVVPPVVTEEVVVPPVVEKETLLEKIEDELEKVEEFVEEEVTDFLTEAKRLLKLANNYSFLSAGRHLRDEINHTTIKAFFKEFIGYGISNKNDHALVELCKKEYETKTTSNN